MISQTKHCDAKACPPRDASLRAHLDVPRLSGNPSPLQYPMYPRRTLRCRDTGKARVSLAVVVCTLGAALGGDAECVWALARLVESGRRVTLPIVTRRLRHRIRLDEQSTCASDLLIEAGSSSASELRRGYSLQLNRCLVYRLARRIASITHS